MTLGQAGAVLMFVVSIALACYLFWYLWGLLTGRGK